MERKSLITRRAGASTPEVELQKALEKEPKSYMRVQRRAWVRVGSAINHGFGGFLTRTGS